jgi:hypothetical protein
MRKAVVINIILVIVFVAVIIYILSSFNFVGFKGGKGSTDPLVSDIYSKNIELGNKIEDLEREVANLQWVQEELKWEIFMLREDFVLDHADICDSSNDRLGCLSILTNIYRSFGSEDRQYCERVPESDLREACLVNYDGGMTYRGWYDSYFLAVVDPKPFVPPDDPVLDKAGLCDSPSLETTKSECLDMLNNIYLAITNSDVAYCNNVPDSDLKNACVMGVEQFDDYDSWYEYYFLTTLEPGTF